MKPLSSIKRKFYLTKARLHVIFRNWAEKFFDFLSVHGFVVKHRKHSVEFLDNSEPIPAPDIKSDRYIFSVSYVNRKVEYVDEYWFETKNGRHLLEMWDEKHTESHISYRAELQAFFAHLSPKQRMWVYKQTPVVAIKKDVYCTVYPALDRLEGVEFITHRCNFEDCRYAFEFRYTQTHNSETPVEVISESYRAFSNGMPSKVTEINKILTGVDYDGELVSPAKTPLSENLLCRKCGLPVFASAERKYEFMCLKHGELEYPDVQRVDPIQYKDVLKFTMEILEDLICESECPQDSNL